MVLYEKESTIGGRCTSICPWRDSPYDCSDENDLPVELGASIFVSANRNLQKAARIFNLTLTPHIGENGDMSVWDGENFVYTESASRDWGWWDIVRMLWRYGRSPLTVREIVKSTVSSFTNLYEYNFIRHGPWTNMIEFVKRTNLSLPIAMYANDYFTTQKINPLFVNELIAAATTVNYGTPVSAIHGVGALVSLAATDAVEVQGGNRKIFDNFITHSNAEIRTSSKVTGVVPLYAEKGQRIRWVVQTATDQEIYDVGFLLLSQSYTDQNYRP